MVFGSGPARTLALVGVVTAAGCATNPANPTDTLVAPGLWGGRHVAMQVTADGAQLEYDCAEGVIDEPLRPDADGRFAAAGRHQPGRGGPIRIDEVVPTLRARYEGTVTGDRMSLTVTLSDTGDRVGRFELERGRSGVLVRCL